MSAINRKLVRDLWHLRSQVAAIALVVACGVATVVTTRTAYESLLVSKDTYYSQYRFADVFALCKRAPETLRAAIERIPGVAAVQTRIVAEMTLDVPGLDEPAAGRLVSIPARRAPILNDLYLRAGRWIDPDHPEEVLVSEAFASANHLRAGDRFGAILNGRWQRLRVAGIALSPEYVYEIRPADLFPDNRRFGVLWMSREAMGPAFDMDGAFNDVVLTLAPGASERSILAELDRLLERYGGLGAFGRGEQISHRFLSDEISQNRVSGTVLPAIFLAVAAFLLNIVLARLVTLQRDQIAVMKAFGYANRTVAWHFAKFALVAVAIGAVAGTGLGLWLGARINRLYVEFYRFPVLRYAPGLSVIGIAIGASTTAAVLGALFAVRSALHLAPAEAMRPEQPPSFHTGWLERAATLLRLSPPARMVLRNLLRRPLRAALSITAIAFGTAILVLGRYFTDAVQDIADVQFRTVQREDMMVSFREPRGAEVRYELAAMPGVLRTEPYRAVGARVRFEHRSRRVPVLGVEPGAELRRLIDGDGGDGGKAGQVAQPPADGVILTSWLARRLGAAVGDELTLEILEGSRPVRQAALADVVDEKIGASVYIRADTLSHMLHEGDTFSGAYLQVDAAGADRLHRLLKRIPAVAGVSHRKAVLASFEQTLARSLGIFNTVLVGFACIIACAMVYNAARIALSERGRELASLRVLGFTRSEVARMLLGEQALLTLAAIPVGMWIGAGMAHQVASYYQWEVFRLPIGVARETLLFAASVTLAAAVASSLLVRRRLDQLDLVEVLKTRE